MAGAGVFLDATGFGPASSNVVEGNFIGTDATGRAALGNPGDGVDIAASGNTVGGTVAGARNVISANGSPADPRGRHLPLLHRRRSRVGECARGELHRHRCHGHGLAGQPRRRHRHLDIRQHGRRHGAGRPQRHLGQWQFGGGRARRLHRRRVRCRVGKRGRGELHRHRCQRHRRAGKPHRRNPHIGIRQHGRRHGRRRPQRHLGQWQFRHQSFDAANLVEGNYIGTDANGTAALGNVSVGIEIFASGNTVGGTMPGARNVISANHEFGIFLNDIGNVVEGNYIGTDATAPPRWETSAAVSRSSQPATRLAARCRAPATSSRPMAVRGSS